MIDASVETTLLIDSNRFGSRAIYRTTPIERINRIITAEERAKYASVVADLIIAPYVDVIQEEPE